MFYILHGEEDFGRGQELAGLRAKLAASDPAMADLNTTYLDGGQLTLGELRHACDTIPFMSDRRLVIVYGLLARLSVNRRARGAEDSEQETPAWKDAYVAGLEDYLPKLPATTRLVFVERRTLPASHPILKLARIEGENKKAFAKHFPLLKDWQLPRWIKRRVKDKGGSISQDAVDLLATLVGTDLRLLDSEIDKLLLYADGQPVSRDDVQNLVSRAREASVFDLVDAVGHRQTDKALQLLHRLLDDEAQPPLMLLGMLARQVRILIQVKELANQARTQDEVAKRLKLHPYVAEKGLAQARNFDRAQLETAHRRLVDTDWSIKTGRTDPVLALDMLVVALSHG